MCCRLSRHRARPYRASATLIVVPPTLLGQWRAEIAKHAGDGVLTVIEYPGVKALTNGKSSHQHIEARQLLDERAHARRRRRARAVVTKASKELEEDVPVDRRPHGRAVSREDETRRRVRRRVRGRLVQARPQMA